MANGTGSVALNNKITPSFPTREGSLEPIQADDLGRRARTANDDESGAQVTSEKCTNSRISNQSRMPVT